MTVSLIARPVASFPSILQTDTPTVDDVDVSLIVKMERKKQSVVTRD